MPSSYATMYWKRRTLARRLGEVASSTEVRTSYAGGDFGGGSRAISPAFHFTARVQSLSSAAVAIPEDKIEE